MACGCQQITCTTCTPCAAVNVCNPCATVIPSPPLACQEDCEVPIYTSDACVDTPISCVSWNGLANTCYGITSGMAVDQVIMAVGNYTKNTLKRLTSSDGSLIITHIDDACDDKATIGLKIDPASGNQLVLGTNGLSVKQVQFAAGSCISFTSVTANGVTTLTPIIDIQCLALALQGLVCCSEPDNSITII